MYKGSGGDIIFPKMVMKCSLEVRGIRHNLEELRAEYTVCKESGCGSKRKAIQADVFKHKRSAN